MTADRPAGSGRRRTGHRLGLHEGQGPASPGRQAHRPAPAGQARPAGGPAQGPRRRRRTEFPQGRSHLDRQRQCGGAFRRHPVAGQLENRRRRTRPAGVGQGRATPPRRRCLLRSYLNLAVRGEMPVEQRIEMCKQAAGLVQRDEEKRLLLGTLGNIESPDAMNLILPYLSDAEYPAGSRPGRRDARRRGCCAAAAPRRWRPS